MSVVTGACLNQATCTILAQNSVFRGDPCQSTRNHLYIEAVCNQVCATATDVATITGTLVRTINFVSYGNRQGSCGSFSIGSCDSINSMSVVANACLNEASCSISVQNIQASIHSSNLRSLVVI
jgi:hypothetical protein